MFEQDINLFAEAHPATYDLIVSNPPYSESAVACRDEARNAARYTETLTHDALLECAAKLITPDGVFSVVLPHEIGMAFETMANQKGWFRRWRISFRDRPGKPLNRLLLTLSKQPAELRDHELALRKSEGIYIYSEEFGQVFNVLITV